MPAVSTARARRCGMPSPCSTSHARVACACRYSPSTHLVQRLVPDTRGEAAERARRRLVGAHARVERAHLLAVIGVLDALGVVLVDEVHLVDEHPDAGLGAVLAERRHIVLKVVQVLFPLGAGNVEHVDEDGDVGEHGVALRAEIVVEERILATAVPQVLALAGESEEGRGRAGARDQRTSTSEPRSRTALCSTSIVAPNRRVSFAV